MTKPNPNNKYPNKTKAAAIATKVNAEKMHRKTIQSVNYIMKHWPMPCTNLRSIYARPCDLPKVVGLTTGRALSATDIYEFTMKIIASGQTRADLQYSTQTFLRCVKPYMPDGLCINADWANSKSRKSNPEVLKALDDLEKWVEEYYAEIESQLLGFYLTIGERTGGQFMKVLERRFREHWNLNNGGTRFEASASIKQDKEATDEPDDKPNEVIFNFSVVQSENQEAS